MAGVGVFVLTPIFAKHKLLNFYDVPAGHQKQKDIKNQHFASINCYVLFENLYIKCRFVFIMPVVKFISITGFPYHTSLRRRICSPGTLGWSQKQAEQSLTI